MKKPTILVVDDEKQFTDTFAGFLSQRFNAKILVRKNAREGIEVLDKQRVDVLFQDMVMPGLGGEAVIEHIKNLDRINEMIIFIISKWNEDARTMKFEDHDVKYMPKPISLATTQRILIEDFEIKGGFDYKKKTRPKAAYGAWSITLFLIFSGTSFGAESSHDSIFNEYINSPDGNAETPVDKHVKPKQITDNETQENSDKADTKSSLQGIPAKYQTCVIDSDCTAGVVDCDSWGPFNKKYSKELFKDLSSCPASIDPGFQPVTVCVAKACKTTEKSTDVSWDEWLHPGTF